MNNDTPEPAPVKPPKLHRIGAMLRPKNRRMWLWAAAIVVSLGAVGYGGFLLHGHINDLSGQNAQLQKKVSSYQELYQNAENSSNTQPTAPLPTSAEDTNDGGTALQTNTDPSSSTKKYLGGEYAPYWLLNPYAITIPDGVKMERSTYMYTDGQLFPYNDEGSAGCGVTGIIMSVTSEIHITDSLLAAEGSSATFSRAIGCGDGYFAYVAHAKYYPVPGVTDHKYKYMEVVYTDCKAHTNDWDADKAACSKSGGTDSTKWTLYSGLVQNDDEEITKGQILDPGMADRALYNRPAKEVTFRLRCPSDDGTYAVNCNDANYKSTDYNAILNDAAYKSLRGIITGMHQTK